MSQNQTRPFNPYRAKKLMQTAQRTSAILLKNAELCETPTLVKNWENEAKLACKSNRGKSFREKD